MLGYFLATIDKNDTISKGFHRALPEYKLFLQELKLYSEKQSSILINETAYSTN